MSTTISTLTNLGISNTLIYMQCSIEDCGRTDVVARGWCRRHYGRWRRSGDPVNFERELHGQYGTPEYVAWYAMKSRCNNPHYRNYKYWGGKGVKVCERWDKFTAFLEDMGAKPTPKHTLDRIDGNGDYTPENCRWATYHEQRVNRAAKV